jgi:ABC-type multidrug transport system fused ATPase/permease subunit
MNDGRIVEQGTHEELLRGFYYQMARHQLRVDQDLPRAA